MVAAPNTGHRISLVTMSCPSDPPTEVSREDARAIAEKYLSGEGSRLGGTRVKFVATVDELRGTRSPSIYAIGDLDAYWIAYVDRGPPQALRSSAVVLVSRLTGSIAYAGSANDEG